MPALKEKIYKGLHHKYHINFSDLTPDKLKFPFVSYTF